MKNKILKITIFLVIFLVMAFTIKDINIISKATSTIYSRGKEENSLNLEVLRTNYESIIPDFNKNIFQYYLVVDETVEDINITAIAENKKAEVIITGNKNLKMGLNIIKITVSLNGDSKNYTINVTKTKNIAEANTNLETLAIEYHDLNPEYNSNITNYHIEIGKDENNVNVLAIPEDKNAKVKVEGNKELNYGQNNVLVTVMARDGITTRKYNIEIYKRNEEEEQKREEEIKLNMQKANNLLKEKQIERVSTKTSEDKKKESSKITMLILLTLIIMLAGIVVIMLNYRQIFPTSKS